MVAEENMFSSVAATDKLRTLIKLTGSLPFPTLQPPIHGRSQGWFYMLRNMCYKLRPTISVSFFNGVTLNKLHILLKPYFPHWQNKVINRTFSTVSEGLWANPWEGLTIKRLTYWKASKTTNTNVTISVTIGHFVMRLLWWARQEMKTPWTEAKVTDVENTEASHLSELNWLDLVTRDRQITIDSLESNMSLDSWSE